MDTCVIANVTCTVMRLMLDHTKTDYIQGNYVVLIVPIPCNHSYMLAG